MENINIYNIINYTIKIIIVLIWVYLYNTGSITLNRLIMFIIVFLLIYVYSRGIAVINYIFMNEKVINYLENNNNKSKINKILNILLILQKWRNPILVFLVYTDKLLYQFNRHITSTKFIRYNFIIYILAKYILMFGLFKLIIYKYYNFWNNLFEITIIDILFKRMYGLILSILILSDLLNNIVNVLSHYNIMIYILIYYLISMLCVIWELLFFYYLDDSIMNFKLYEIVYNFNNFFVTCTNINMIIAFRNEYTWLGHIILNILRYLIPEKKNYKEEYLSVQKLSEKQFFMGGRIIYYKYITNLMAFSYLNYFGIYFWFIEPSFKAFWEDFKYNANYHYYFKPIREIKYKPSQYLYHKVLKLAKLYDVYNQPINRFMYWMYFDIKFNEYYDDFDETEKFYIKRSLNYLRDVDELRAKLLYFIIWDIEYYYSKNKNDYKNNWDYWNIIWHSMLDQLYFKMEYNIYEKIELNFSFNDINIKNELKFYDPEENMEFLNRLFNILGVLDNTINKVNYYVSAKFNKYNERYVELFKIMHSHNFNRIYEPSCDCSLFSLYEVRIAYRTEAYFQNLRKEWLYSIENEKLEERNWSLLKITEDLMD